jgi:predicted small lipoprotein YifL
MKKMLAIVAIASLTACGGATTEVKTDSTSVKTDSTQVVSDSTKVDSTITTK